MTKTDISSKKCARMIHAQYF